MKRTAINPSEIAAPGGHFSHGVIVEAPRTLYVAGQVALDPQGILVGPGDPVAQATQVFDNIRAVVETAGGRVEDIAKTSVFLVNLDDRNAVGEVRRRFFGGAHPANTLLVVKSLASPDFLVEVEAIVPLPASP